MGTTPPRLSAKLMISSETENRNIGRKPPLFSYMQKQKPLLNLVDAVQSLIVFFSFH